MSSPVSTPSLLLSPADLSLLANRTPVNVRVLDVRTPGEFQSAHIRGAYNVPLDTLGEHSAEISSNVQSAVVLVCQSGGRAHKAEQALRHAGMTNLHVLEGGMNAWRAAGLPIAVVKHRLSLERQVRIVAGFLAATGGLLGFFVNPAFALLPALIGSGLAVAGITDWCWMGLLLSRMPHNRASCDVPAMVRALSSAGTPTAS